MGITKLDLEVAGFNGACMMTAAEFQKRFSKVAKICEVDMQVAVTATELSHGHTPTALLKSIKCHTVTVTSRVWT